MDELKKLLASFPHKVDLNAEVVEREDCGSYVCEKVTYSVEENDRISAYVCVPKDIEKSAPAIFVTTSMQVILTSVKAKS